MNLNDKTKGRIVTGIYVGAILIILFGCVTYFYVKHETSEFFRENPPLYAEYSEENTSKFLDAYPGSAGVYYSANGWSTAVYCENESLDLSTLDGFKTPKFMKGNGYFSASWVFHGAAAEFNSVIPSAIFLLISFIILIQLDAFSKHNGRR